LVDAALENRFEMRTAAILQISIGQQTGKLQSNAIFPLPLEL
jgi:hypothetical protein